MKYIRVSSGSAILTDGHNVLSFDYALRRMLRLPSLTMFRMLDVEIRIEPDYDGDTILWYGIDGSGSIYLYEKRPEWYTTCRRYDPIEGGGFICLGDKDSEMFDLPSREEGDLVPVKVTCNIK